MTTPEQLERYEENLLELILKYGWAIQHERGRGGVPGFSYTVGLCGFNAPEMVIFGLEPTVSQIILNAIADGVRDGKRWVSGDRTGAFLVGGRELAFIDVANSLPDLIMANRTYLTAVPVPALQVVWPDRGGAFPWELGWALGPQAQPLRGPAPTS